MKTIAVTSAVVSDATFQMTAKAEMTDGSLRDVTAEAQWMTSDAALATISAGGVLTVLRSGEVDVRATYQNVTGSLAMMLDAPHPPSSGMFILAGTASETPPAPGPLESVTVRVIAGPDAGRSAVTDSQGRFGFSMMQAGTIGLEATKDGYIAWRLTNLILDHDRQLEVFLYPTPPADSSGATATARCNDGSWSWAQTRDAACVSNGGIAYAVCPGPICGTQTSR